MALERHVATVPAELSEDVRDRLLTAIEQALVGLGASRVWIDATVSDFAVMAVLSNSENDT